MPTAIESAARRRFLGAALTLAALPARADPRVAGRERWASAWAAGDGFHVGIVEARAGALVPLARLEVPTRAHAVVVLPDGDLVAIARRPGDWMLRWTPGAARARWMFGDGEATFNGHALADPAGRWIATTETVSADGSGRVVLRAPRTLAPLASIATRGMDPHAMLADGDTLLVANGGIPAQAERGREKVALDRMDASLVRLDPRDGSTLARWRLADPRLSLRHLARAGTRIGVALQAEHDDPVVRASAPLLAVLEDAGLRVIEPPPGPSLGGYAGDIAAVGDGFAVSATRGGRVASWSPAAGWSVSAALDEPCALAIDGGALWVGTRDGAHRLDAAASARRENERGPRIDNHWVRIA